MSWFGRLGAGIEDIFRIPPGFDGDMELLKLLRLTRSSRMPISKEPPTEQRVVKPPDEKTLQMIDFLKNGGDPKND